MLQGCDVSSYQDDDRTLPQIDFVKMKNAGAKFVYIRASQSLWKDPDFDYNWSEAKKAGLARGAYCFFSYWENRNSRGPKQQAKFFADLLQADPGELPPMMDYEQPNATFPPLPAQAVRWQDIQSFGDVVDQATGRTCGLYCNGSFLKVLQPFPAWLTKKPLWIAAWPLVPAGKTAEEVIAAGWKPATAGWDWTIWQYSSNGSGPKYGVESLSVDMDYFNGDEPELAALIGAEHPAEPVHPLTLEERIAKLEAEARTRGWPV